MRTAGFQDVDEMATTYYTGKFEKRSIPAIMQCSSRSRQLKPILEKYRREAASGRDENREAFTKRQPVRSYG
ncbi:hypothetical protein J7T55_003320 [Diaporthe amygdali]|uniref:uncharacterized protein n=1 Tax=Phomopsis amygdali TaxID=1214568 RepID=UPI0022FE3F7E|nr:uncharacterized protein J7T55_003320 [Diaporthe amygdali]KAJ0116906.1 hypothetical protein J7T55_003320 [Diaporthe amygdali]